MHRLLCARGISKSARFWRGQAGAALLFARAFHFVFVASKYPLRGAKRQEDVKARCTHISNLENSLLKKEGRGVAGLMEQEPFLWVLLHQSRPYTERMASSLWACGLLQRAGNKLKGVFIIVWGPGPYYDVIEESDDDLWRGSTFPLFPV